MAESHLLEAGPVAARDGDPWTSEARELVCHLSHSLRQPLSTLEAIAFLLDSRANEPAKTRHQLNLVLKQVQDVLENAAYFVGATPARPKLFDLKELLAEVLVDRHSETQPHLAIDMDRGVAWVHGDPNHFAHMLRCQLDGFHGLVRRIPDALLEFRIHAATARVVLTAPGVRLSADEVEREMEPLGCLACAERIAFANRSRFEVHCGPDPSFQVALRVPLHRPY